ncbi:MAG: SRPBCC family protein [Deferribacteres bacterium]|nr:SRPBCC family protein [candidate division KSB1 bacterium]MCB9501597.1 SRPBCC family protein [Deferribacteres bacterium]
MYKLQAEQTVPASMEKVWDFIKNPNNLNKITPEKMGFEILSDLPEEMYPGMIIEYKISIPFMGKWHWVTELKHLVDGMSFVDEQRFGPYKFWYHYHKIESAANGTRVIDQVYYKLPFGIFGRIAHVLFVKRMLKGIFDFRKQAFAEALGE